MNRSLQVLMLVFLFTQSFAQLTLVKDINTDQGASGNPNNLTSFQGTLFFEMDGDLGHELWKNDGGIFSLVKDIRSGRNSSNPDQLIMVNNILFFVADDGVHGSELWKSDGTTAGTVLVKDVSVNGGSFPQSLTNVNGVLYFTANDGAHGEELWSSDGSENGTVIIKDINPGTFSSRPKNLTEVNGTLFFSATDGVNGFELWKSDGSGTSLIKDIKAGATSSSPYELTDVNGTLFFAAIDGINGYELWKSDGTVSGTQLVHDIFPGAASSMPAELVNINGILFLAASDDTHGIELWKSNGTNTSLVKDLRTGPNSAYINELTNVNGTLFFVAEDDVTGTELWTSNGADAGTLPVSDIASGIDGSYPYSLTAVGDQLYFVASTVDTGTELWRTDGTSSGTFLVLDIQPGVNPSLPDDLLGINSKLFFKAYTGNNFVQELWQSDGTPNGTFVINNIPQGTADSFVSQLTEINNVLFFESNYGIWKSDGTTTGTKLVKDFSFWPSSLAHPAEFTEVNGILYFAAENQSEGMELWRSDGTEVGTTLVKDIWSGGIPNGAAYGSSPNYLVNINGVLYFTAEDAIYGRELWKSNGTAAGTVRVKDILSGAGGSSPFNLTNINGTLYFNADDGVNGLELWKSDGTDAGTVLVKDICGGCDANPSGLTMAGSDIFFSAYNGIDGYELWKTDGTPGGTQLVRDINTVNSSNPSDFTNVNEILFFSANAGLGRELWKSDGTEAGTVIVRDASYSFTPGSPGGLMNLNGVLYFSATDAAHGWELWKSDGTPSGTVLVKDIAAGTRSSYPWGLTNINGILYFIAYDNSGGDGLWRSDGTDAGTWLAGDEASIQSDLVLLNNTMFFSANLFSTGSELWKYELAPDLIVESSDAKIYAGSTIYAQQVTAFSSGTPFFVKLKNVGSSDLTSFTIKVSGNHPADFVIDASTLPASLAPGAISEFSITFSPKAAGIRTSTIEIITNDPYPDPYVIKLEGDAAKADQSISFPEIPERNITEGNFYPGATATSNNPVVYTSSDNSIAYPIAGIGKIAILKTGTVTITASQPGSDDYNAAAEVSRTLKINKGNQSISFQNIFSKKYGDEKFLLYSTATSFLPVDYSSSNSQVAIITGSEVTIVGAGTTTITASQNGNENFYPAPDAQQILVVNKANQVITFEAQAPRVFGNTTFDLNGSTTSGLELSYTSSNSDIAAITGKTITILKAGTTIITASQSGNENYLAAAAVQQSLLINKESQTLTFGSLPVQTVGTPAFDLNSVATSGLSVTFTSSDPDVATISGKTVTILKAGTIIITASQAGNENYSPAVNVTQSLVVNKKNQNIAFLPLAEKILGDAPFTLGAIASSGLPVSYTSSNPDVININGSKVMIIGVGETIVTASQDGDSEYNAAAQVTNTLVVKLVTGIESGVRYAVNAYPNPATQYVLVETAEMGEGSVIRVFDSSGKFVCVPEILSADKLMFKIDIGMLNAGVYYLQINRGKRSVIKRIVKK